MDLGGGEEGRGGGAEEGDVDVEVMICVMSVRRWLVGVVLVDRVLVRYRDGGDSVGSSPLRVVS